MTSFARRPGPQCGHGYPSAASGDFALDVERSRIGFTARHALISKVRGHFERVRRLSRPRLRRSRQLRRRDDASRCREHRHRQRPARRAAASQRVPGRPDVPDDHFRLDRGRADQRPSDSTLTGDLTIKATTREVTLTLRPARAPSRTPTRSASRRDDTSTGATGRSSGRRRSRPAACLVGDKVGDRNHAVVAVDARSGRPEPWRSAAPSSSRSASLAGWLTRTRASGSTSSAWLPAITVCRSKRCATTSPRWACTIC